MSTVIACLTPDSLQAGQLLISRKNRTFAHYKPSTQRDLREPVGNHESDEGPRVVRDARLRPLLERAT